MLNIILQRKLFYTSFFIHKTEHKNFALKKRKSLDFSRDFEAISFLSPFDGAAGRSRTDTVSLPPDFESGASANFTTAAHTAYILYHKKLRLTSVLPQKFTSKNKFSVLTNPKVNVIIIRMGQNTPPKRRS